VATFYFAQSKPLREDHGRGDKLLCGKTEGERIGAKARAWEFAAA
jgi:hypothetical protein